MVFHRHYVYTKEKNRTAGIIRGNLWRASAHTSKDSFYMWTKTSCLEIDIFGDWWKMIQNFLFWNSSSPFRVAAAQCQKICPLGLNWPCRLNSQYLWRGLVNFKINSRPLFTIIFKAKNVNFKTRDFSPLIEWVLAGVLNLLWKFKTSNPLWYYNQE